MQYILHCLNLKYHSLKFPRWIFSKTWKKLYLLMSISLALLSYGFSALSYPTNDYIQKIKEKRRQNKISFESYITNTQPCIRVANQVSTRFAQAQRQQQERLTQVNTLCGNQVISEPEAYKACVFTQISLIQEPEQLISFLSDMNQKCFPEERQKVMNELTTSLEQMKHSIAVLREKYEGFLINNFQLQEATIKETHNKQGTPFLCQVDISSFYRQFLFWDSKALLYSDLDQYGFEKSLKAMDILKDKISTAIKVCKIDDDLDELETSEKMIQDMKSNYSQSFSEFTQKACSILKKTRENKRLCEEPLNNQSWKYSISQALQKQLGYTVP